MLGQDWRGFKHDHQYRVSNAALREAARLASERWADFSEPDTFEPIIAATRKIQAEVSGLGPMWDYDAPERDRCSPRHRSGRVRVRAPRHARRRAQARLDCCEGPDSLR